VLIYLLSTQALLDILTDEPVVVAWRKTVAANAIEISAVSIGEVIAAIEAQEQSARRRDLHAALNVVIAVAGSYQGIIPFDDKAAQVWAHLERLDLRVRPPSGQLGELNSPGRMVLATCLSRAATLVEGPQDYHSKVKVNVVSP